MSMRLGDYIFEWDPDDMTPPERMKPVGRAATFGGSALFQWGALWSGARIELKWDWMSEDQFQKLRTKYLSTDQFEFNPDNRGESFYVVVTELTSGYFKTVLHDFGHRKDVRMVLEVRSVASTTTTTTTTTSSTTTTTAP